MNRLDILRTSPSGTHNALLFRAISAPIQIEKLGITSRSQNSRVSNGTPALKRGKDGENRSALRPGSGAVWIYCHDRTTNVPVLRSRDIWETHRHKRGGKIRQFSRRQFSV